MGADVEGRDAFAASRARFAELLEWCDGGQGAALDHGELEELLDRRVRELLGQLLADRLDLGEREARLDSRRRGGADAGGERR